jgi:hypothetical protein
MRIEKIEDGWQYSKNNMTLKTYGDGFGDFEILTSFGTILSFPVKNAGDVFHSMRMGQEIPEHCKNY